MLSIDEFGVAGRLQREYSIVNLIHVLGSFTRKYMLSQLACFLDAYMYTFYSHLTHSIRLYSEESVLLTYSFFQEIKTCTFEFLRLLSSFLWCMFLFGCMVAGTWALATLTDLPKGGIVGIWMGMAAFACLVLFLRRTLQRSFPFQLGSQVSFALFELFSVH